MRGKTLHFAVALMIFFSCIFLTACDPSPKQMIQSVKNTTGQFMSRDVNGKVGKTYSTTWFEFAIESVKTITEYDDYIPAEGNVLYDVLIKEKNIYEGAIPMGTFDFHLFSPALNETFLPLDPLDENMMPAEFSLEVGKTVEYHMIYEVPQDASDLSLKYIEVDDEDKKGKTFTFEISE